MSSGEADYTAAVISSHASVEMARRRVSEAAVRAVLANPGRRELVRTGRVVLTSLGEPGPSGRAYVLRVFVDADRSPMVVVTVYRSSKIGKYWSKP
ncbi:MAG: hypothetical protein C0506_04780 [Anaerolinea sp.]|nr:hypothetical protein [Anaerolinea sp.]